MTERVDAANRLGACVPYPYPVRPRWSKYGSPRCPVCPGYALSDQDSCPDCGQQLLWTEEDRERYRRHEDDVVDRWMDAAADRAKRDWGYE